MVLVTVTVTLLVTVSHVSFSCPRICDVRFHSIEEAKGRITDARARAIVSSIAFEPSNARQPDNVELTVYNPDIFRLLCPSTSLTPVFRPRVRLNVVRVGLNELHLPPIVRADSESPSEGLAKFCTSLVVRDVAFFGLLEDEYIDAMRGCALADHLVNISFYNSYVKLLTGGAVVKIKGVLELSMCDFVGMGTAAALAALRDPSHFRVGSLKVSNCKGGSGP